MRIPWSRLTTRVEPTPLDHLAGRALLISIRPRFADAILDGTKTVELRRTAPTLQRGALALIYSSSPTKALVGWATVDEVVVEPPTTLWREHRDATGVTSTEFKAYFAGKTAACGLQLSAVERATNEIGLDAMRSLGLEPPQSWRYLPTEVAEALHRKMAGDCATTTAPTTRHHDFAVAAG